jgi:hypothetical protein
MRFTQDSNTLTQTEAIKARKIHEFIAQEEAKGVPAADLKKFEDLADRLIKEPLPANQTSRSSSDDDSNGK